MNDEKTDNVMNLEQKSQNQPQRIELPTHVEGKCANCRYKLSLPFPIMPIFNHQVASSVVVPHSKGITCIKCGVYHNIAVVEVNIQLAIVPMERLEYNNEEKLIIPVHGKLPKIQ